MGKTTACGKLALYLQKQKKSVLMVATDVYRPAAIDQLQKLGQVGAAAGSLGPGAGAGGAAMLGQSGGEGVWDGGSNAPSQPSQPDSCLCTHQHSFLRIPSSLPDAGHRRARV